MHTTLNPVNVDLFPTTESPIQIACRRIPPLWPIRNFVAVNPFLGLTEQHVLDAAVRMTEVGHGDMLMPAHYYVEALSNGRILESDVLEAFALARETLPEAWSANILPHDSESLREALTQERSDETKAKVLTFADFLDARLGTTWAGFVVEEVSKWCSAYYDQGQSSWRTPWRHLDPFQAWKAAASLDLNPEMMGMHGFRKWIGSLPSNPLHVIQTSLDELGVPEGLQERFLHRELMSIAGWAGHAQFLARESGLAGGSEDPVMQLLAVRLTYDLVLFKGLERQSRLISDWLNHCNRTALHQADYCPALLLRYIAQLALELGYQRTLIASLKSRRTSRSNQTETKALQAVFCIDVRSEVFRRSLEAESEAIETYGFAGFFGVPIEYLRFGQPSGGSRCPVLLTPKLKVRESIVGAGRTAECDELERTATWQSVARAWNSFKTSAISCFSFVETAGLGFGIKIAREAMGWARPECGFETKGEAAKTRPAIERETCCAEVHRMDAETGIALSEQITLAAGALRNMGLLSRFARVVLICGHGSSTTNNPYGSGLDCGACGGHAGDANARVLAAILNKSTVRTGLRELGITIPEETLFVAALHNTTTDEVLLYDVGNLTATQATQLREVRGWLEAAGKRSRKSRARSLGLNAVSEDKLDAMVQSRTKDWSQVRPEWGLAGNAAFIAAPRSRTAGVDLAGRTFLHSYDSNLDPERSVLSLVMVAPMVVASWINLQYYASTVDNRLFGSGNKVLHNVVGTIGVWQGNGGDLQVGLPMQSVHDGTRWVHEPLRLTVVLEATEGDISRVLEAHPDVAALVENGWIHLLAIEPGTDQISRYHGRNVWRACGTSAA